VLGLSYEEFFLKTAAQDDLAVEKGRGGGLIRSEPGEISLIVRLPWVKVYVMIIRCILASSVKRCIKKVVAMLGTAYLNLH